MKITFVEKKYKIGNRFKDVMSEKLSRLDKYFTDETTARVVCSAQNKIEKVEVNINCKGVLYRAEVSGNNNYDNIDLVLPKLEKQIVRTNEKRKEIKAKGSKQTNNLAYEFLEEEPEAVPEVYKTKTFDLDPMPVDEARFAIERLGHDFFVFLNAETGKINILYRRKDGKFGLIDLVY